MKNHIAILIIQLSFSFIFSQNEKDSLVTVIEYYKNGNIKEEGVQSPDLMKHGKWTSYYSNGQIQYIRNYQLGVLNGEAFEYSQNGQLKEKYFMKDGLKEGQSLSYGWGETLESEFNYSKGLRQGISYNYNWKGNILSQTNWKDDKKHGTFIKYCFHTGKIEKEFEYEHNEYPKKYYRDYRYYSDGNIRSIDTYLGEMREGISKIFYPDGQVEQTFIYSNDQKNGKSVYFSEDGEVKREFFYLNDKLNGISSEYYGANNYIQSFYEEGNLIYKDFNNYSTEVQSYQSEKIYSILANTYSYIVPVSNISIRKEKSLKSSKIGVIKWENHLDYEIKDNDNDWYSIYLNNNLFGYCKKTITSKNGNIKNLFRKEYFDKIISTIKVKDEELELHSIDRHSGSYYYVIKDIESGEELYSKGDKYEKNLYKTIFNRENISESIMIPSKTFYSLNIKNKQVGWLVGSQKNCGWADCDFSASRVLIPVQVNEDIELYNNYTGALILNPFSDYLTIPDNQIQIIKGKDLGSGAGTLYYYLPEILKISYNKGNIEIEDKLNIEISDKFIESDLPYAYVVSLRYNDKNSFRKIYELVKSDLSIIEQTCSDKYENFDLSKTFENEFKESIYEKDEKGKWVTRYLAPKPVFNLLDYFSSYHTDEHKLMRDNMNKMIDCNPTDLDLYYIFSRTGLFPSSQVILEYLNSSFEIIPTDYFLHF